MKKFFKIVVFSLLFGLFGNLGLFAQTTLEDVVWMHFIVDGLQSGGSVAHTEIKITNPTPNVATMFIESFDHYGNNFKVGLIEKNTNRIFRSTPISIDLNSNESVTFETFRNSSEDEDDYAKIGWVQITSSVSVIAYSILKETNGTTNLPLFGTSTKLKNFFIPISILNENNPDRLTDVLIMLINPKNNGENFQITLAYPDGSVKERRMLFIGARSQKFVSFRSYFGYNDFSGLLYVFSEKNIVPIAYRYYTYSIFFSGEKFIPEELPITNLTEYTEQ